MTRTIPRFDTAMLQRAQRIAALTLASVALAAPALTQAQAAAPTAQQQAGDKAAADAFKRTDANQDGKLSRDEAARLPAIAARFDELDKDKDGALSLEEFMAGYMK
jgi:ABC-type transporter MlaC component